MKFKRIIPSEISAEQEAVWQSAVSVVGHMLTTEKAKTFNELCEEVSAYNRQFFDHRDGSARLGCIALDLVRLLEGGFVAVVEN